MNIALLSNSGYVAQAVFFGLIFLGIGFIILIMLLITYYRIKNIRDNMKRSVVLQKKQIAILMQAHGLEFASEEEEEKEEEETWYGPRPSLGP